MIERCRDGVWGRSDLAASPLFAATAVIIESRHHRKQANDPGRQQMGFCRTTDTLSERDKFRQVFSRSRLARIQAGRHENEPICEVAASQLLPRLPLPRVNALEAAVRTLLGFIGIRFACGLHEALGLLGIVGLAVSFAWPTKAALTG